MLLQTIKICVSKEIYLYMSQPDGLAKNLSLLLLSKSYEYLTITLSIAATINNKSSPPDWGVWLTYLKTGLG